MRIDHIEIRNFLGIAEFNHEITSSTCLVYGPNGSGKSSIQNAIRMFFTGEPSRVNLKKFYGKLVKDGESSAYVCINDDKYPLIIKRTGETKGIVNTKNIKQTNVAILNPGYLTSLTSSERKEFLFSMIGRPINHLDIKKSMIDSGIKKEHVNEIMRFLEDGFDSAHQHAKTMAAESRGVWKGITGETYGIKKAENWKPERNVINHEVSVVCPECKTLINTLVNKIISLREKSDLIDKAKVAHEYVCEYTAIEQIMSPSGIPWELIKKDITLLNNELMVHAETSGWSTVFVDENMEITSGGHDYNLLSESEQWRVDAMISTAIANLTDSGFIVIDRVDVLDEVNLMKLFDWCISLEKLNIQTLLFGTLQDVNVKGIQSIPIDKST